jgi:tetratricopeptide (TPR) repeat protein
MYHSSEYNLTEGELNSLGYYLLRNNDPEGALKIFILNVERNPASGNAFDSVGDGYLGVGNKAKAIESFKKSVALNPSNSNAAEMIRQSEKAL